MLGKLSAALILVSLVPALGFVPGGLPLSVSPRLDATGVSTRPSAAGARSLCMKEEGGGFFGNLINNALLKVVEVKEKEGTRKKLQKCVFCEKGVCPCESCKGTGKDIALGSGPCFSCDGKGKTTCGICNGVGMVDRVRRGGTDTEGKYVGSDKVMDPITPQFEPYILTLDGAEKYVWCQCGVSVKQPFCDGVSHRAYGLKPVPFTAEGEKGAKVEAQLCGCKYSNTKPYCDGTHVGLKAQDDEAKKKNVR
uniref:Iron-binding zinc finger CDGSH type domain-containing protein n=1 Tax=Hemiselmis andersenii TaxID=464988 RepID=A0A6U5BW87_HEMAN|mmetsp:Transcript_59121/g.142474  ORF Transcript_59121/g.142474 Transcript_59121/m.142474 type:complete len:251 (+) Transcript_59121:63-815(+)